MDARNIGYIRVSTTEQNTARQLVGVTLDRFFEEKVSGKDMNRPALQDCLAELRGGDILHVHEMSRLGRSLGDLLKIVERVKESGATVHFHKEGLTLGLDEKATDTLHFNVMAAFAQFERALIKERQAEGIAAAKAAGKHLGRPSALTPEQITDIRARAEAGVSKARIAADFGLSRAYIYRITAEQKA
jgi:DNA invertase Pin-like site-specific DNA recombinase